MTVSSLILSSLASTSTRQHISDFFNFIPKQKSSMCVAGQCKGSVMQGGALCKG